MKPGAVAIHDDKPNNVLREVHAEFGDTPPALPPPTWCARRPSTSPRSITHMEPNATLAEYDIERDGVTLHTTTQVPYYVHLKVAACLA